MSARSRAGTWRLLLVTLMALTAVGVTGTGAASAHAVLESTSPAAGSTVATAPTEVVLTFDEAPLGIGDVVQVTGPGGATVSVGKARVIGKTVHQTLATGLGGGGYRVDWKVTSDDGHPVSSTFRFTVTGPAATSVASPSPSTSAGATPSTTASGARPPTASAQAATSRPWPVLVLAALVLIAAAALAVPRTRALILRKKP